MKRRVDLHHHDDGTHRLCSESGPSLHIIKTSICEKPWGSRSRIFSSMPNPLIRGGGHQRAHTRRVQDFYRTRRQPHALRSWISGLDTSRRISCLSSLRDISESSTTRTWCFTTTPPTDLKVLGRTAFRNFIEHPEALRCNEQSSRPCLEATACILRRHCLPPIRVSDLGG